jgi:hypothetical protein
MFSWLELKERGSGKIIMVELVEDASSYLMFEIIAIVSRYR